MSKLVDGVFHVTDEPDKKCEFCGLTKDCRPYGPGGKQICWECSELPQYKAVRDKTLGDILKKSAYVVDASRQGRKRK